MEAIAWQGPRKRWLPVFAGLLAAFLLIAPFFVTLAWDEGELGPTPGAALIGAAVLVMVASLVVGPEAPPKNLNRIRNALLVSGIVLSVVGIYAWR